LITYIRIFAIADKYSIYPLKSLSVAKFEAAAYYFEKTNYFIKAVQEVYNLDNDVLDNMREMRNSIVKFIYKQQYLLYKDHIKQLMLDKP
ncbi:hypothetical protein FOC4_g10000250, partial [Fusarium odoratissimum]